MNQVMVDACNDNRGFDYGQFKEEKMALMIADKVYEKLLPKIDILIKNSLSGVVIGARDISMYMGLKSGNSGTKYHHGGNLVGWFKNKGFPMGKTPGGKWWVSKSAIDRWLHERSMITRKGREMGIKGKLNLGNSGGGKAYLPPEGYTEEDRGRIMKEIIKDRIKRAVIKDGE